MTEPNTIKKTLVWTDNNNELVDTISKPEEVFGSF